MGKFEYYWLSHEIDHSTPSYGNRDKFESSLNNSFQSGATAETSNWKFSNNHIGTHVDAPRHFIENGLTISDFPAPFWVFGSISLLEIDVSIGELITPEMIDFSDVPKDVELILLKTDSEKFRFEKKYWESNPGIDPSLGSFLRNQFGSLRCIGFDFISVTSFSHRSTGKEAHLSLLQGENPLIPIEDMKLSSISSSDKILEVIVLPIRVHAENGAPVSIIAKIEKIDR
jgi:kynurenine formamidase